MMRKRLLFFIAFLFTLSTTYGQDSDAFFKISEERNDWTFSISPYAFLAAQSTDVEGEGLRQSFKDLSSMTNFGFQAVMGIQYKRWSVSVDGTYARLGSGDQGDFLSLELGINQWIVDTKFGYIFAEGRSEAEDRVVDAWLLSANIGPKYWQNDVNLEYTLDIGIGDPVVEAFRDNQQWIDLMIGLQTTLILSRAVKMNIIADYGGFGIGNSAKYSWSLTYVNTFRLNRFLLVTAGFRNFQYLRVDDGVENKVNVTGPLIGATFVL